MLYNTHDVIVNGSTINATSMLFLGMFSSVAICPIMPRFIISIRERYERRGDWQGIDTGFGLSSLSQLASENATLGANQIAGGNVDEPEAIQVKVWGHRGDNTHQV